MDTRKKLLGCLSSVALFFSSVLFLTGCNDSERLASAELVLQKFSRSCRSHGFWANAALAHTRSLEEILISIKTRNVCQGVEGILSSVQSLNSEIQRILKDPAHIAVLNAEERKRQILVVLATAPAGSALQQRMEVELVNAEFSLIEAKSQWNVRNHERGHRNTTVSGLTQMNAYLQALFSAQTNLVACAKEEPLLALQITSSVLALSGAFVHPALGPAMAMSGQILNGMIRVIRDFEIEDALEDVRLDVMTEALACGLEAMTDTYCEAHDLLVLTELRERTSDVGVETSPLMQGFDLWKYKVPDLLEWFRSLATGVEPQDQFAARRQNAASQDYFVLKQIQVSFRGVVNEINQELLPAPSTQRDRIIRRGLKNILEVFYFSGADSGRPNTPISNQFSENTILLYRLAQAKQPPQERFKWQGIDTIDFEPADLTFDTIVQRAEKILEEVSDVVLRKVNLVLDLDTPFLINEANHPAALGHWSPREVMDRLLKFFNDSEIFFTSLKERTGSDKTYETQQTIARIQDTIRLLQNLKAKLTALDTPPAPGQENPYPKAIEEIFRDFHLIYGDSFISKRLARLVRWDLETRIRQGDLKKSQTDILLTLGKDALEALEDVTRPESLDYFTIQLQTAKRVSEANIHNFVTEIFPAAFDRTLEYLDEQARYHKEPMVTANHRANLLHRPNFSTMARICVLLLALPKWPEDVELDYCLNERVYLVSSIPDRPPLRFRSEYEKINREPPEERVCAYRNYMRGAQIFKANRVKEKDGK